MSTLSTSEILMDVMDAFKVIFPMLNRFGTDFSSETAKLDQTVIARISSLPTVRDYDGTTGYQANAANANGLTTDVPVTLNRHKHVPVKVDYLEQLATKRDLYNEAIKNLAYALGKEAFDYAMSLVVDANFSQNTTFSVANSDKDMLTSVTKSLNIIGAAPRGRFGIVSSAVFETLDNDARIASKDYHGQQRDGEAYGHLKGVAGFEDIYEYPGMPTNSENLSSFFGDRRALVMASRVPKDMQALASRIGLPQISKWEPVTDPDSGLTLMAITWQEAGTFDVYTTLTWIYGISAGSQGGADGALTDYAGHRIVTA
jgi:hypothetical protein